MISVVVSIEFHWEVLGEVRLDSDKRLVFPKARAIPGLYRFDIEIPDGKHTYIGESDQLARRMQHYRTPGPSQQTNIRLNKCLRTALETQPLSVTLAVVVDSAAVRVAGSPHGINLSHKLDRVLLEHAAILAARISGRTLLNK